MIADLAMHVKLGLQTRIDSRLPDSIASVRVQMSNAQLGNLDVFLDANGVVVVGEPLEFDDVLGEAHWKETV